MTRLIRAVFDCAVFDCQIHATDSYLKKGQPCFGAVDRADNHERRRKSFKMILEREQRVDSLKKKKE